MTEMMQISRRDVLFTTFGYCCATFVYLSCINYFDVGCRYSYGITERLHTSFSSLVSAVSDFTKISLEDEEEVCTLHRLREKFILTKNFPLNSGWINDTSTSNSLLKVPYADFCSMPNNSHLNLTHCLLSKQVRKIAVLGDSNGLRYARAMEMQLGPCRQIKTEIEKGNHGDASYFLPAHPNVLQTATRGCSGCSSYLVTCQNGGAPVQMEYISMEYIMDNELTTDWFHWFKAQDSMSRKNIALPLLESHTTQQFIFKEYFHYSGYPDLILHFANSHDENILTEKEIIVATELLTSYYTLYVPNTTQIVFFSKPHIEHWLKPVDWRDMTYEGRQINDHTQKLNEAHAIGLQKLDNLRNSNIWVYFDLLGMGNYTEIFNVWGESGVHKQQYWYLSIIKNFLSIFCHE